MYKTVVNISAWFITITSVLFFLYVIFGIGIDEEWYVMVIASPFAIAVASVFIFMGISAASWISEGNIFKDLTKWKHG